MNKVIKLAICQMLVSSDKETNIGKAAKMIGSAAANGADLAVLPEMFNCPYDNSKFAEFAEKIGEKTTSAMSAAARENGIYLVAGSIPELNGDKLHNTSIFFDRKGDIIGFHRKMHLFDIHIPGKISFRESETLAPGSNVTVVNTEIGRIGIAICYDMRFPELVRLMALKGAELVVVPAAFNMTTGPAHWELTIRARALDNQVYFAASSPARDEKAKYVAYGHSMVASPWGDIVSRADEKEQIIYADIDFEKVEKVRNELPLLMHRRTDVYRLEEK